MTLIGNQACPQIECLWERVGKPRFYLNKYDLVLGYSPWKTCMYLKIETLMDTWTGLWVHVNIHDHVGYGVLVKIHQDLPPGRSFLEDLPRKTDRLSALSSLAFFWEGHCACGTGCWLQEEVELDYKLSHLPQMVKSPAYHRWWRPLLNSLDSQVFFLNGWNHGHTVTCTYALLQGNPLNDSPWPCPQIISGAPRKGVISLIFHNDQMLRTAQTLPSDMESGSPALPRGESWVSQISTNPILPFWH